VKVMLFSSFYFCSPFSPSFVYEINKEEQCNLSFLFIIVIALIILATLSSQVESQEKCGLLFFFFLFKYDDI
jgi:hypothetical protein